MINVIGSALFVYRIIRKRENENIETKNNKLNESCLVDIRMVMVGFEFNINNKNNWFPLLDDKMVNVHLFPIKIVSSI
jgi:hypothetical protein